MKPERWQRIEQLYHAALEREAEQRAGFLAEACVDDAALRREVEVLLTANEQASGSLHSQAFDPAARVLAAEDGTVSLGVQVGQAVSHYTILSHLGAGGMGEVFLAHDTMLERPVALKLLPIQFSEDAERLQRFVREAKAASALNHPNIITIYETGEIHTARGKTQFIATEFIEGETLRTWRAAEAKRLHQAVSIAIQIASALAAAHRAGIVHRDIKPENVMLRPDGLVKVLDFGLAKLTTRAAGRVDHEARTLALEMKTRPGILLGTLCYMSPEQARGRSLDGRSDIFSLGVVLYEMLTRQPLFAGETKADVIAAIIHKEAPALAQYLPAAPAELERIVQKALAKDIEQRYQDAGDLQMDLQTFQQESEWSARLARSGSVTRESPAQTSSMLAAPRFSLWQLLLGLPVGLLLVGIIWWLLAPRGSAVETPLPASLTNTEVVRWASVPGEVYSVGAFSPDGKWIAFVSSKSGTRNIWVRQTVSGEDHQSTKDEFTNESPIWSPTGDAIAFFSLRRGGQPGIWRMPSLGGTLTRLKTLSTGADSIRLLHWSKDGATIYYESKQQLFALNVESGEATPLTSFDQENVRAYSLNISPDEKQIAYITTEANGHLSIWCMPARGGSPRRMVETAAEARNTAWHPDGERLFYSSNVEGTYQIFVADRAGHQPAQITFGERDNFVVDVSADGTKVLCGSSEEKSDIWGVKVAKAEEFVVASDISSELWPDIAPDNKTVAYQAVRNLSQGDKIYNCAILTKALDAKAEPFVLAKDGFLPKWSPDGKQIAFMHLEQTGCSLRTVNAAGGEEQVLVTGGLRPGGLTVLPYTRTEASEFGWSADGRKLAYCAMKDGVYNLHTVAADGASDTPITDNRDANLLLYCPLWSAHGKRIAYTTRPSKIATPQDNIYRFWVAEPETKTARAVAQMTPEIRLLGWSQTDQELLFARRTETGISIWRVAIATGEPHLIAELPAAKYSNIHLSPDRRTVAYVSHQDDKDNLWVIPAGGGVATRLTANHDPLLYFSSLAWSPDSQAIYYGRQSRYSLLSMITNFK